MYISSVKIRNYRNLSNNIFDLNKDVTTLIGENGTGKTNVLNAIKIVLDNRNKSKFTKKDFSCQLKQSKGHWIIISINFKDVPDSNLVAESATLNPTKDNESTISLIYRPNKIVRMKIEEKYNLIKTASDEESDNIYTTELQKYINEIDIDSDYEIKFTVGELFDFNNDNEYKNVVGDFDNLVFNPVDEHQENTKNIGNRMSSSLECFDINFIPAIRNVENEFDRKGNFFEKMLIKLSDEINETEWNNVQKNFSSINDSLKKIDTFHNFANDLSETILLTVGDTFNSNTSLDVSYPLIKDEIVKNFKLAGIVNGNQIELNSKSLGENNIIYFALKIMQSEQQIGHTKKIFKLLMIEEPEAHLHKHLQQTFLNGIKNNSNNGFQLILSTHSVHISESSNIDSVIVLGNRDEGVVETYYPTKNLQPQQIKYLERYLDSMRIPVLFAKKILFVEGDAEQIFIDNIIKLKYETDLNNFGISLISINGCFFENLSLLFNSERIRKKCSILTDLDNDINGEGCNAEKLSVSRVTKLEQIHINNEYVKIFTNKYTFEIELFLENLSIFKEFVKERKIYQDEKIIDELTLSYDFNTVAKRILLTAKKVGKGWLALDFVNWLKEKGEDTILNVKLPQYIIDAITFLDDKVLIANHKIIKKSFNNKKEEKCE